MRMFRKTFHWISNFGLGTIQMQQCLMPRVHFSSNINPVKMAYDVYSSQSTDLNVPPLIVMHGLLGLRQNFRRVCKGLEDSTKRKIYNVDARNHGESPHDTSHSSAHMAADIALLLQNGKHKRASLMGHSMGGRAVMFFALKYPQMVEKAIIVDISPVGIPESFQNMDEIFTAMKSISVPANATLGEARKMTEKELMKVVGDKASVDFIMMNFRKLKNGQFGWAPNISALHSNLSDFLDTQQFNQKPFAGPVRFICGKHSQFFNPADWPKVKQIFPKAEMHWIDSGHLIHFEQPVRFMELVTKTLIDKKTE